MNSRLTIFKMRSLMLFPLSFIIICFAITSDTLFTLISPLIFFSILPILFNYWLVPGGFAWRSIHHENNSKIRGPLGWPLFGNIPQMGSLAHRELASLAVSCGATRLMALSLGTTRMIISSHPETAKEILTGASFSDRPMKESARFLMFERAIGFAPSGNYWRHLRWLAASHMFSPRRISDLEPTRQEVANKMAVAVTNDMEVNGFVELRGILQKCSLDSMVESVFGKSVCLEGNELGFMVKEGYELIGKFNWEDFFPLGFLDFHGVKRRCNRLASEVTTLVGRIIKERRIAENYIGKNDFLSILLSLPQDEQLRDSDMVAVLWEMIFRGTDAVAILVEWIMARMTLHQDIQAKVHEELEISVGHGRHVQDSDIPNLPYLQSIVKEVLRMHPPGPLLSWARLAAHDVYVDKIFVPAGTTAMVNMWAISHDPSIWKDPWTFRPERFKEEEISVMGSDLRLAPFGSGRRACPGKVLGLATVHLWVARLVHQFKWLPAQPVDLSECLRLSMEMKKPLICRVLPRLKLMVAGMMDESWLVNNSVSRTNNQGSCAELNPINNYL